MSVTTRIVVVALVFVVFFAFPVCSMLCAESARRGAWEWIKTLWFSWTPWLPGVFVSPKLRRDWAIEYLNAIVASRLPNGGGAGFPASRIRYAGLDPVLLCKAFEILRSPGNTCALHCQASLLKVRDIWKSRRESDLYIARQRVVDLINGCFVPRYDPSWSRLPPPRCDHRCAPST